MIANEVSRRYECHYRPCVYQYALKLEVDAIVTRNQKDFEKSHIKVFDRDELFAYLAEEKGLTYEEMPW